MFSHACVVRSSSVAKHAHHSFHLYNLKNQCKLP